MANAENAATILHNTYTVIAASDAACAMFRCHEEDLLDLDLVGIVADEDMRGLARLRLNAMRTHALHAQDLPLWRPNGTKFYARVQSYRLDAHTFLSTLTYQHEIKDE